MMTPNEAKERAAAIWGDAVVSLEMTDTGGCYVDTLPQRAGQNIGIRIRNNDPSFENHHLDGNGHPTCHTACKQREEAL